MIQHFYAPKLWPGRSLFKIDYCVAHMNPLLLVVEPYSMFVRRIWPLAYTPQAWILSPSSKEMVRVPLPKYHGTRRR